MTSVSSGTALPNINFEITEKNLKTVESVGSRFLLRVVTENGERVLKAEPRYSLRTLWHLIFDRQSFKLTKIMDEVVRSLTKGRKIGKGTRRALNDIISKFNDKQNAKWFHKHKQISIMKKVTFDEDVQVQEFYLNDAPEALHDEPPYSQKTNFDPKPHPRPKSLET